jgi:hypothetical protein
MGTEAARTIPLSQRLFANSPLSGCKTHLFNKETKKEKERKNKIGLYTPPQPPPARGGGRAGFSEPVYDLARRWLFAHFLRFAAHVVKPTLALRSSKMNKNP